MGKKLFVGGLSWDTDDQGLRRAFAQFGEIVEAKVVTDRDTGRSRGFGFVTFQDEKAAEDARAQMNGQTLDGRSIKVDAAQDKPREGGANRYPGGPRSPGNNRNRF